MQHQPHWGEGLFQMERFFGCKLGRVDSVNLTLALRGKKPPQWLSGNPTLETLPRFKPETTPFEHLIEYRLPSFSAKAEFIEWVMEETVGQWSFCKDAVMFDESVDAVKFKLVWC
jgi:hypothetical protein